LKALFPLAIIGSSELVKIGNKVTKGRRYEWGTVSVENELHCDFVKLREMLLSTNLLDLIELTHTKHFQLYRAQRLKQMGFIDYDDQINNQSIIIFIIKIIKFQQQKIFYFDEIKKKRTRS
jgi:septin 6/8/11